MSWDQYLPLMIMALKVIRCIEDRTAKIQSKKGTVTLWDILGAAGECVSQDAEALSMLKRIKVEIVDPVK